MRSADVPTPEGEILDRHGRPYFLWDAEMSLEDFERGLTDPDPEVRAYLAGKLMRQARPADVERWLSPDEARKLWPHLSRYLGRTRESWRARLGIPEGEGRGAR
jgi:hypothetical protein